MGPAAMAVALSGKFLFVADRQSNQVSEFKIATGTGVLTPNTQASIATGLHSPGCRIRAGTTVNSTTLGITDYCMYPIWGLHHDGCTASIRR